MAADLRLRNCMQWRCILILDDSGRRNFLSRSVNAFDSCSVTALARTVATNGGRHIKSHDNGTTSIAPSGCWSRIFRQFAQGVEGEPVELEWRLVHLSKA
jgi:hypothetical protein